MEPFAFKKINLFGGRASPGKKGKNTSAAQISGSKLHWFETLARYPHLFILLFALAIAYLISYVPVRSLSQLSVDQIAPADIVAPADTTLIDEETTEQRRDEAEAAVIPVYNFDVNIFLNTTEKIREFFNSGRAFLADTPSDENRQEFVRNSREKFNLDITLQILRELVNVEFSSTLEETLISLIGRVSERGIVLSKNLLIHDEQEKGLKVVRSTEDVRFIPFDQLLDESEAMTVLQENIGSLEISENEKNLLIGLSRQLLAENLTYDPVQTSLEQAAARQSIDPVFFTIKKGRVIIRKGDEVSAEIISLISKINENLSAKPSWVTNFAGTFILFLLLFFGLFYYLRSRNELDDTLKKFLMSGITLVLSALLYKFAIFIAEIFSQNTGISFFTHTQSYNYAFPFQLGALLFTYLSGIHLALIFSLLNGILVGYLFKANFPLMIFSLMGGFFAILGTRYFRKYSLTPILRASILFLAPLNVLVITVFKLLQGNFGPLEPFASEVFMGIVGGIISGALAFLLTPIYVNLFGVMTQSRLLELTNSDLPIFRRMAMVAPGSYHHSLVVASLAENAAEEIELDPLLVKAGALYHDIGKIKRPEYFIENRTRNFDMHKDLKPSMSSLVIINHVKEGVEQARKLRLPRKIRDIIAQHHGNSLVRYFFEKAKEKYDPEMQKIGEESYRYAGPKPKSKEAALVMLADSVEAASRSIPKPTKSTLKRLITEIFNNNIQDGQLDDSNLSLKEMKSVADSFLSTLYTIYHPRVEYPGFSFNGKKTQPPKPKTNHDRNSQSAEKT